MSTREEIISSLYDRIDEDGRLQTTAGVDGLPEPIEKRADFALTDEDFEALARWYLAFSEKRELLGHTNHLLYICRKQEGLR